MPYALQDFFRPEITSSSKALKKYLESEGLPLGFRDLLCLRQAAERSIFFSLAFIEAWSASEFSLDDVSRLLQSSACLDDVCIDKGWSTAVVEDEVRLVGLRGELDVVSMSKALSRASESNLAPLHCVYGEQGPGDGRGAGGLWAEEYLQQASATLLDGEAADKLVEAFRYLFRAAPSGSSRASVVATALARHRDELNREVCDRLEEFAPALGQALSQLLLGLGRDRGKSLHFLLAAEALEHKPGWIKFWLAIKPSVLEGLARWEDGCSILYRSLPALGAAAKNGEGLLLTPRLLDVFLSNQKQLGAEERLALSYLLQRLARYDGACLEALLSRLELSNEVTERVLIGEALRRCYLECGEEAGLDGLLARFAREVLSVGSTSGSLALFQFLGSFGFKVLECSELIQLAGLSERQILNVTAFWGYLLEERPQMLVRVIEVFISTLVDNENHWSLLLKCSLLQREEIIEAFTGWYGGLSPESRRRLVGCTENWALTTPNRQLIAEVVSGQDWGGLKLWGQEWTRATLNFQRLGWYCLCLQGSLKEVSPEMERRIVELLALPLRNLYFWDLVAQLLAVTRLSSKLCCFIAEATQRLARTSGTVSDEEREILVSAQAAALLKGTNLSQAMEGWVDSVKDGGPDELWWTLSLVKRIFSAPTLVSAHPLLVSSIARRLLLAEADGVQRALGEALDSHNSSLSLAPPLPLEVQNLGLQALAAISANRACPPDIRRAVEKRLALFLLRWTQQLTRMDDLYFFRSTPLFELVEPLIEEREEPLQSIIDEAVEALLEAQKYCPGRLQMGARQSLQNFLKRWARLRVKVRPAEVASWRRALEEL